MLEACHGTLGNVKELDSRVEQELFEQESIERKRKQDLKEFYL